MRISDWSSDVCSSDLQFSKYAFELPQGNLGQASFPVVYAEPDLRVTELTLPEEMEAGSTVTISFKVENVGNRATREEDRKSVVSGKSVSVRVDRGGRRNIKKKNNKHN